jgi:hypothetical protein
MNSRAYRPAILSPAVPVVSVHGSSVAGGSWGQQTGHSDLYSWTRLTSSTGRPQVVVSAPSAQLCILKSGLCVSALERHGRTMMDPLLYDVRRVLHQIRLRRKEVQPLRSRGGL